ncbi:MAG: enoyl-CoA hydratase/isomerase family protein [Phycisphaerales bacterium]|nr:enoyl-CoA hydratase/isomerase family protein [Phycisphaerales bacterium]
MSHEKSHTEVHFERTGDVATILFRSETGLNIFSSRVIGALGTIVERLATDARARFVVIRGEGKVFLAGADIAEMSRFSEDQGLAFATHGHNVFNALEALPQPTFAAMNGHAMGGGCEMALACDFRLLVAGAMIGQPEVRLGLIPGWGGTQRLPRTVGLGAAKRMLYSGEPISAEEALRIGLVDEIVPAAEQLDAVLRTWFDRLAPAAPTAITRIKRTLRARDEIGEFAKCFICSDAKEGLTAFQAKRPPTWAQWNCEPSE